MTSFQIERTLFKFTRHKISLIILTVLLLNCLIYSFSNFIIEYYSINSAKYSRYLTSLKRATNHSHSGDVIYFNENVPEYKLNVKDYGDVCKRNVTSIDENLDTEVKRTIKKFKSKIYVTTENVTLQEIMFLDPISYLKDYKNPCFTQKKKSVYHLKCLPYFFVVGFTKCGTTDFHGRLIQHPFVTSGWTKEPHWWDEKNPRGRSLQNYIDNFHKAIGTVSSYQQVNYRKRILIFPAIIGDFTPRTVWHGTGWKLDVLNKNQKEPKVLIPHKIKHLIPKAKIIVLIRNPTDRLYSDYLDIMVRYNNKIQPPSPQHFHYLVTKAIYWWNSCINKFSEKACAYGFPKEMPTLDEELGKLWRNNSADRLRIGLYAVYLKEWISTFGQDQVKIIVLEKYKKNPLSYIETHIFPFLELPPLNSLQKKEIKKIKPLNSKHVRLDPKYDLPMSNSTRKILDIFYERYNRRLGTYVVDLPF